MRRHRIALTLILASSAAFADPVTNVINGVSGLLTNTVGGTTNVTSPGGVSGSLSGLPSLLGQGGLPVLPTLAAGSSPEPLPGFEVADGVAGVSVLQDGLDGSGYNQVLQINQETVLAERVNGLLPGQITGGSGNGETVDIAILDGNGTSHAGGDGMLSAALLSGDDTATGGAIGVAVLSGTNSGYGGEASVGALNEGDFLHVCLGGDCVAPGADGAGGPVLPATELAPGVVVGGGPDNTVTSSNELVNAGVLTGDSAGTGGLVGVGVIAGDNSGSGEVVGACVLCGDNAGSGPLGVAVLSGDNAGNGSQLGTAVLSGDNSGNGGTIGTAILSGNNSGNGGQIGVAVLSGPGSGNGGLIGVDVLNGNGSSNGGGGNNSGGGGLINPIQIPRNDGSGGNGANVPGSQRAAGDDSLVPDDSETEADDDAIDQRLACLIIVKNVKDTTTQSMKRTCRNNRAG
ncbi:MAG TPA: hypothetical protein VM240_08940 [Verrucomicrobiae bacterium]|nr:hypothetical protein [Verrucomicrobiae bacterium]